MNAPTIPQAIEAAALELSNGFCMPNYLTAVRQAIQRHLMPELEAVAMERDTALAKLAEARGWRPQRKPWLTAGKPRSGRTFRLPLSTSIG